MECDEVIKCDRHHGVRGGGNRQLPCDFCHGGQSGHMNKRIYISSSGTLFGFVMRRNLMMAACALLLGLVGFGVWGAYNVYHSEQLSIALQQARHAMRHEHLDSDRRIAKLTNRLQGDKNKLAVYARTLGQMQARMARLDALGSRLVDVAALDKSEFDFSLTPAFGGVRQQPVGGYDADTSLHSTLDPMDAKLKQLDAQLAAVDFMLEQKNTAVHAKPHTWPTAGGWISSGFGPRIDPFSGRPAIHRGVDIANHFGAPVLAASTGVVTFAGKMEDFGYVVDIDHGYGYKTRYAHLSSLTVHVGDVMVDRQMLGRIGSTGHSTGPHLHYEVRHDGKLINPSAFLRRG